MKYLIKFEAYKIHEGTDALLDIVSKELEILKDYFRKNWKLVSNDKVGSTDGAYIDDEGSEEEYVAICVCKDINAASGDVVTLLSATPQIVHNKKGKKVLHLNLNIEGYDNLIKFLKKEISKLVLNSELSIKKYVSITREDDNLLHLLNEFTNKGYSVTFCVDIIKSGRTVHSIEQAYDKDNMYGNTLNLIKYSKEWYKFVPIFVKVSSDEAIRKWWRDLGNDADIYKQITILKKDSITWNKIISIVDNTGIVSGDKMGDMGF